MLSQTTLANELEALTNTNNGLIAAQRLATAYDNYFQAAMAGPIPVAPTTTTGARTAMQTAMGDLSTDPAPGTLIQLGVVTYWGIVVLAAATIFVAAPPAIGGTPPVGLATLQPALSAIFSANTFGELSLSDSAASIAGVLHPAGAGGIILFPPPGGGGIGPQVVV